MKVNVYSWYATKDEIRAEYTRLAKEKAELEALPKISEYLVAGWYLVHTEKGFTLELDDGDGFQEIYADDLVTLEQSLSPDKPSSEEGCMSDKVDIYGYRLPKSFEELYRNNAFVRSAILTGVNNNLSLEDVLIILTQALIEANEMRF